MILHEKDKVPLENIIKLVMEEYVQEDTASIISDLQNEGLGSKFANANVQVVGSNTLLDDQWNQQWTIITDVACSSVRLEVLAKARKPNGIIIILSIPFKKEFGSEDWVRLLASCFTCQEQQRGRWSKCNSWYEKECCFFRGQT